MLLPRVKAILVSRLLCDVNRLSSSVVTFSNDKSKRSANIKSCIYSLVFSSVNLSRFPFRADIGPKVKEMHLLLQRNSPKHTDPSRLPTSDVYCFIHKPMLG